MFFSTNRKPIREARRGSWKTRVAHFHLSNVGNKDRHNELAGPCHPSRSPDMFAQRPPALFSFPATTPPKGFYHYKQADFFRLAEKRGPRQRCGGTLTRRQRCNRFCPGSSPSANWQGTRFPLPARDRGPRSPIRLMRQPKRRQQDISARFSKKEKKKELGQWNVMIPGARQTRRAIAKTPGRRESNRLAPRGGGPLCLRSSSPVSAPHQYDGHEGVRAT